MSNKGVDGDIMLEIAECADVGAGTVYNEFKSKDEIAVVMLEEMSQGLAMRIERVTEYLRGSWRRSMPWHATRATSAGGSCCAVQRCWPMRCSAGWGLLPSAAGCRGTRFAPDLAPEEEG